MVGNINQLQYNTIRPSRTPCTTPSASPLGPGIPPTVFPPLTVVCRSHTLTPIRLGDLLPDNIPGYCFRPHVVRVIARIPSTGISPVSYDPGSGISVVTRVRHCDAFVPDGLWCLVFACAGKVMVIVLLCPLPFVPGPRRKADYVHDQDLFI